MQNLSIKVSYKLYQLTGPLEQYTVHRAGNTVIRSSVISVDDTSLLV